MERLRTELRQLRDRLAALEKEVELLRQGKK
jgi:cell division protein FtsB